jgi:hypothetical protein
VNVTVSGAVAMNRRRSAFVDKSSQLYKACLDFEAIFIKLNVMIVQKEGLLDGGMSESSRTCSTTSTRRRWPRLPSSVSPRQCIFRSIIKSNRDWSTFSDYSAIFACRHPVYFLFHIVIK